MLTIYMGFWIGKFAPLSYEQIDAEVDRLVAKWGLPIFGDEFAITLQEGDPFWPLHYLGWNENDNVGGLLQGCTLGQVKRAIDRFHSHGWRVILVSGLDRGSVDYSYQYCRDKHPELCMRSGEGRYMGLPDNWIGPDGYTGQFKNRLIPDIFKNFETPDTELNINAGERLLDIYTARLGQAIIEGLKFDGIHWVDGWNGFAIFRYEYKSDYPTRQCSISIQETNEFATDYVANGGTLPDNWAIMTMEERAVWVRGFAQENWRAYWSRRWAEAYKQIKDTFENNNPGAWLAGQDMYSSHQADVACNWSLSGSAHHSPGNLWDIPVWQELGSIGTYLVSQETVFDINHLSVQAKGQAYTVALIKAKNPSCHVVSSVQPYIKGWPDNIQEVNPVWAKMNWLLEQLTFVFHNGVRYRGADKDMIWHRGALYESEDLGWYSYELATKVFTFIKAMRQLTGQSIIPIYLGPCYVQPSLPSGWTHFWFTHVRTPFSTLFVDERNLSHKPDNINESMGSLLLESSGLRALDGLGPIHQKTIDLFTSGLLNLIIYWDANNNSRWEYLFGECGADGITALQNTFGLAREYPFNEIDTPINVLDQTDPVAKALVSNSIGSYLNAGRGGAFRTITDSGTIDLAQFNSGRQAISIKYGAGLGRFLAFTEPFLSMGSNTQTIWTQKNMDGFEVGLFNWASHNPVYIDDPFVDSKTFQTTDKKLCIALFNYWHAEGDTPIKLNLSTLEAIGLITSGDAIYWQSDKTNVPYTSLDNVQTTLRQGVDVLVISTVAPPTHTLAIDTIPITNVSFVIDGASVKTPYSELLVEKTYTVEMPEKASVNEENYVFLKWQDGVTNRSRIINLTSDITLTATFKLAPPTPPIPRPAYIVGGFLIGGGIGYSTTGNPLAALFGAVAGGALVALATIGGETQTTTCIQCGETFTFTTKDTLVWCPSCGQEQIIK